MQLSKRRFVSWLGWSTVIGSAGLARGAGSPAEALSTILRDSKAHGEKAKGGPGAAEAAHKSAPAPHKPLESPDEIWADLLAGNRRFMSGKPKSRPLVAAREELAQGQHPQVIVLGCADSRVSPELVFDKNLGELFVVRTAGNIAGPIALGSLEYGAEHLHAKVLVVLGHEKCGAVAAAASGEKMPTANLDAIVKKIFPVIEKYTICAQGDQLLGLAVEANVQRSARDDPTDFVTGAGLQNDVNIESTHDEILFSLRDGVPFASGKANLRPRALPVLEKLVTIILAHADLSVAVSGHTDSLRIASAEFSSNWELSAARASRVARYLIEKGIHPARISVQGYADYRPRKSNSTAPNRRTNRRVEIRLMRNNLAPPLTASAAR